jgi:hypothetical protein
MVDIKRYELKVFGAIAIIGGLIWGIYFYRSRRKRPLAQLPQFQG